jgi:PKD repeat protein
MWLLTLLVLVVLSWAALGRAANQPPVANAGPDQTAYTDEWVTCNGTVVDPEGDPIIGYAWEVVETPPSPRYQSSGENTPNFQLLGYTQGDYVATLTVWDGMSARVGTDQVTIRFRSNQPPVAVAAVSPTHIVAQDTVCFDGSGSHDPEEGPLVFLWDFGDGTMPQYGVVAHHAYASSGSYSATLQVTDERNATTTLPFVVEVGAPVAVPGAARAPAVTLWASGSGPSNPRTSFGFSLPQAGRASLVVYDVRGARVATLVDADLPAGEQGAQWGGTNERGEAMPSGVYFCRLVAGGGVRTVKFALVK